jgi:hypothetical protein
MPTFNTPDIPAILEVKEWETADALTKELRADKQCVGVLANIAKAWAKADLAQLGEFLKTNPPVQDYNAAKWAEQCDHLCRDIIVKGVMDIRESVKRAAVTIPKIAAGAVDGKTPDGKKTLAYVKKLSVAAEGLLKALRPEEIENCIRAKESEVTQAFLAKTNIFFGEIAKSVATIKTTVAPLIKSPLVADYNGFVSVETNSALDKLCQTLRFLGGLPKSRGVDYSAAAQASVLGKELSSLKPLPATAAPAAVLGAWKTFLLQIAQAAKLPKVKL